MITIHHLDNSRSQRILWLAEELELDYEIYQHRRDKQTSLSPDSLKAIHPLGRAPIVCIDDLVLVESAAIIEYLIKHYDNNKRFAKPTEHDQGYNYDFWMHFAEGSIMPSVVAKFVLSKSSQKVGFPFSFIINKFVSAILFAYFDPNLKTSLDFVESHLAKHSGFIGETLSAVDIQMTFPLEALVANKQAEGYPAINAYVKKMHQRPAYQRALKRSGTYAYATSNLSRDT